MLVRIELLFESTVGLLLFGLEYVLLLLVVLAEDEKVFVAVLLK